VTDVDADAERQLDAAFDAMPDPVVLLTAIRNDDGSLLDFRHRRPNPAFCRLVDRSAEQLGVISMLELLPMLRRRGSIVRFGQTLRTGEPWRFWTPGAEPPASPRALEGVITRVDPDTLLLTLHDVSELEAERQALAEADERYRTLVASMPDRVVAVFDRDLTVRLVGGAGLARAGIASDSVIGRPMTATLPAEHAELVERVCRQALAGRHVVVPALIANGRTWRFDLAPLTAPDGTVSAGMALGLEITDQVQVEADRDRLIGELQQAQRLALLGSWRWDAGTGELWLSPQLRRLFGLAEDDATGEGLDDDVRGTWSRQLRADLETALADRRPIEVSQRVPRPGGYVQHLVIRADVVLDDQGQVAGLHGTAQDVTAHRLAQDALAESEERFRLAFDESPIGKALIDPASAGAILRVNPALCQLLGSDPDELVGTSLWDWVHPDDQARARAAFTRRRADGAITDGAITDGAITAGVMVDGAAADEVIVDGAVADEVIVDGVMADEVIVDGVMADGVMTGRVEIRLRSRRRGTVWAGVGGTTVCDVQGRPLYQLAQLEDVTARRQAEIELVRQARFDPLTGLPNRVALIEHLERLLTDPAPRLGVLFLDLDDFKTVNDSLGHVAGDRLIERVAVNLNRCLGPDDFAARWGGDEFVVVSRTAAAGRAADTLAQRIRAAIHDRVSVEGHEVSATVSIGVAFAVPGSTAEGLLRDADIAMYRAKAAGKDRWATADSGGQAGAMRRLTLASALRHAVEEDQLCLHYQPVIDLADGRMTAVEALLRWQHPERGLLGPAEFLDVAEGSALIVPVGEWAIREASRQAMTWIRKFGPLAPRVAVNVSARQLGHARLTQRVRAVLAETGLPASWLCIELTEREVVSATGSLALDLAGLHEAGVKLAVDDVGTGYAGLAYLRRFPVDVLKIDQSLTAGMGNDATDTAILISMVTLGRALGLDVIAEGVETSLQLETLIGLGCPQGQGSLWSPPVTADGIEELLVAAVR
jgi:diguanylate cyclase (GGDEF)-like protein